jgi:hypothetical protein
MTERSGHAHTLTRTVGGAGSHEDGQGSTHPHGRGGNREGRPWWLPSQKFLPELNARHSQFRACRRSGGQSRILRCASSISRSDRWLNFREVRMVSSEARRIKHAA